MKNILYLYFSNPSPFHIWMYRKVIGKNTDEKLNEEKRNPTNIKLDGEVVIENGKIKILDKAIFQMVLM